MTTLLEDFSWADMLACDMLAFGALHCTEHKSLLPYIFHLRLVHLKGVVGL